MPGLGRVGRATATSAKKATEESLDEAEGARVVVVSVSESRSVVGVGVSRNESGDAEDGGDDDGELHGEATKGVEGETVDRSSARKECGVEGKEGDERRCE